jgi:hypothetical protein
MARPLIQNSDDGRALEALVDKYSLECVIDALAVMCLEKADHVRSNWQDETLACDWERDAEALEDVKVYN